MLIEVKAPQVEVTLDRNNMILSPDCKAALDKIIKNEKHGDVVRFLKDYGKSLPISYPWCITLVLTS